ncbi:MAG: hypothetical protein AB9880_12510 [Christensenellales bacterium]
MTYTGVRSIAQDNEDPADPYGDIRVVFRQLRDATDRGQNPDLPRERRVKEKREGAAAPIWEIERLD